MSEDFAKIYEQFANFFVFDEWVCGDVFARIEREVLPRAARIRAAQAFTPTQRRVLLRLARGDRKRFAVTRELPKAPALAAVRGLLSRGVIGLEKSSEPRPQRRHGERLPRAERRHRIQDKLYFTRNFERFWFYFIEREFGGDLGLNSNLARDLGGGFGGNFNDDFGGGFDDNFRGDFCAKLGGDFGANSNLPPDQAALSARIRRDFDAFCAGAFERVCAEFLARYLNLGAVSSFWDRRGEIDIFARAEGFCVAGEVKWRSGAVCKSVLQQLRAKCDASGICADIFALFSKGGFSQNLRELAAGSGGRILLFEPGEILALMTARG